MLIFIGVHAVLNRIAFVSFEKNNFEKIYLIFYKYIIPSAIFTINSTPITLIVIYISEMACQQLNQIIYELRKNIMDFEHLLNQIVILKKNISSINKLIGFGLFVKILDSGLAISAAGYMVVLTLHKDFTDPKTLSKVIGSAVVLGYSTIDLLVILYSNLKLIGKCQDVNQEIETKMINQKITIESIHQTNFILNLINSICLNAFLFDIRKWTCLTILGQIGSYTVILIQTELNHCN